MLDHGKGLQKGFKQKRLNFFETPTVVENIKLGSSCFFMFRLGQLKLNDSRGKLILWIDFDPILNKKYWKNA